MGLPFSKVIKFRLLVSLFVFSPTAVAFETLDRGSSMDLTEVYHWLHQNPELSFREKNTSAFLAEALNALGFEVKQGIGNRWVKGEMSTITGESTDGLAGYGLLAILRNGPGPVAMIRTDMDALPVVEETGLPYASTKRAENFQGKPFGVMHACGHDVHMTTWLGVAREMVRNKNAWSGTLMMVAQPAEELGLGAISMIEDRLMQSVAVPDYVLAFHVSAELAAGQVGYIAGQAMASIASVDIRIKGVGGHGAYPHTTKDPVVISAHIVTALQTLVSRTVDPRKPAVVTVGSLVAGTKRNIISDEATLMLTVRTYDDETREKLLEGITRIAKGQAQTFGAPPPDIKIAPIIGPSVYNDPDLTDRVVSIVEGVLGEEAVLEVEPVMAGEDFGRFGRQLGKHNIPSVLLWLGTVDPKLAAKATKDPAIELPPLHSPMFGPHPDSITIGVRSMTSIVMDLLTNQEGNR